MGDAASFDGDGIYLNGATLNAGGGNITLNGTGESNGVGVLIESNSALQTSGNGAITVIGTGSEGIALYNSNVQTAAGPLTLTGADSINASSYSYGLDIENWNVNGSIQTTSGAINLTGTGWNNGGEGEFGIYSGGFNGVYFANIRTDSGTITINGTGGTGGSGEQGVYLDGNTIITATGTGNIAITGTAGNGTDGGGVLEQDNSGVWISRDGGTETSITVNSGNLTITGTGSGAGSYNDGIHIAGGAVINSTGSGSITLTGTGVNGAPGILMDNTADANANTIGSGSTTGNVRLNSAGDISLANMSITTGGGSVTFDADTALGGGAIVMNTGTSIATGGGDIVMGGGANPLTTAAVGDAVLNIGIDLEGATLNAAGGNITMNGTGYAVPTGDGFGIILADSTVQTTGGTVALSGTGRGAEVGIEDYSDGGISLIQTTSGAITMNGTCTDGWCYGMYINGAFDGVHFARIETNSGTITMNGTSNDTGHDNEVGTWIDGDTIIEATGTGNISISGTGGDGLDGGSLANANVGVLISRDGGTETSITVNTGNLTITGTGSGAGSYNAGIWMQGGAVINSTGSGSITLTGTGVNGAPGIASDNSYDSHTNAIGSGSSGAITLIADSLSLSNETIDTAGTLTVKPYTSGTTVGIGTGTGNLSIDDTTLGTFTYGSLVLGGSNAGAMDIDSGVTFASPVTFQTGSGHDITLGGALDSSASGTAFTLASGGNFINDAGSSAFDLTGGGRWLVYSANPSLNTMDGLAYDFKRYDCTYGGSCPSFPGSGDGMLYSIAPTLIVTADNQSKAYGAALPTFTGSVSGSGLIDGDSLGSAVSGSPAYGTAATSGSNAGNYAITPSAGSLASTLGYSFMYVNGTLTIDPAPASSVTIPSTVEAVITQQLQTPTGDGNFQWMPWAEGSFGQGGTGQRKILFVDASYLQSLGYDENDPHPWWDGVVR